MTSQYDHLNEPPTLAEGGLGSQLTSAFARRRVLVTGHTGFKGSWLAIWLHRLGAQVVGYALPPPTQPSNFLASHVDGVLTAHYEGDIQDPQLVADVLRREQPEVVFHLAAQPLVRRAYQSPRHTFSVNVLGTACLLDAVRTLERPCVVVVVTSDKCYENEEHIWGCRECDPMGGHDPYSASKGAAELLVSSYRRSFFPTDGLHEHGIQLASVRAGNVIGGGDWAADRIVPDTIRALVSGVSVPVRSPHAQRPWQHVLEPLSGYLSLAANMLQQPSKGWCGGWNFGPSPESEIPVWQVVDRLIRAWGSGTWQDCSAADRPHESRVLHLSIDKAVREMNWRPCWQVSEALHRTAVWYRQYHVVRNACMRALCLEQIDSYMRAAESASPTGAAPETDVPAAHDGISPLAAACVTRLEPPSQASSVDC